MAAHVGSSLSCRHVSCRRVLKFKHISAVYFDILKNRFVRGRGYDCFHTYPKVPTPYRYLNSGTWIGRAKNAELMLLDIINKAGTDFANANDQKLVSDMYIKHKHEIKIDYTILFKYFKKLICMDNELNIYKK